MKTPNDPTSAGSTKPELSQAELRLVGPHAGEERARPVVWKFGGTSVADPARLRALAARLVAARREGARIVTVLSAMGDSTDDLVRLAQEVSSDPPPRELDALLSVGESISCALAAMAVHELGGQAISLTGPQAGIRTDGSHGNARLQRIGIDRILEALDRCGVVLVTGFQGVSAEGDVTTLGRGGSDTTAIALAAALGLDECHIFTDVPGVFTADPRVVPDARMLDAVSHEEMLQLADAGARVLQTRAVELAAAHDVDVHVRSSFTFEPGTWVRRGMPTLERERVVGVAHVRHDPLYSVAGISPGAVSAALAGRRLPVGFLACGDGMVRFTAGGAPASQVTAALASAEVDVAVVEETGSVSVVSSMVADRSEVTTKALSALEDGAVGVHLLTTSSSRLSCLVPAADVDRAAQLLHDAFGLADAEGGEGTRFLEEARSHA